MSEINENPKAILDDIKNLLSFATTNRKHSYHTPVFSNVSLKNTVESRIVVLRKFNENKLILNFHSDCRSPKIKDLEKKNNSHFIFYDPKIKIQLRIKTLSVINNQNNITKQAWDLTNLSSRKCYLTKKFPSSITLKPEDGLSKHLKGVDPELNESEKGYKNFVVVENIINNIDWLQLSSSGHRRLNINFENKIPRFDWLIP